MPSLSVFSSIRAMLLSECKLVDIKILEYYVDPLNTERRRDRITLACSPLPYFQMMPSAIGSRAKVRQVLMFWNVKTARRSHGIPLDVPTVEVQKVTVAHDPAVPQSVESVWAVRQASGGTLHDSTQDACTKPQGLTYAYETIFPLAPRRSVNDMVMPIRASRTIHKCPFPLQGCPINT